MLAFMEPNIFMITTLCLSPGTQECWALTQFNGVTALVRQHVGFYLHSFNGRCKVSQTVSMTVQIDLKPFQGKFGKLFFRNGIRFATVACQPNWQLPDVIARGVGRYNHYSNANLTWNNDNEPGKFTGAVKYLLAM